MIINFHCKKTKRLFETDEYVAELDNIKKVAQRKLIMLHQASSLEYLRQFPNNQLEKLRGERIGQ
jgi:proteic killer suppression protein